MKIQPINNTSFGIYKGTRQTYYGYVDSGVYRDKAIDIYNSFNDNGTLKHKLYYVSDLARNWLKSKLKFFRDNKCYYTARSETGCQV